MAYSFGQVEQHYFEILITLRDEIHELQAELHKVDRGERDMPTADEFIKDLDLLCDAIENVAFFDDLIKRYL